MIDTNSFIKQTPLFRSIFYIERKLQLLNAVDEPNEELESMQTIAKPSEFLKYYYKSEKIPVNVEHIFEQLDLESKRLLPLGGMILNRKPNQEEMVSIEGRGARIMAKITHKTKTFAPVYTKGVGAKNRFEDSHTSAFPDTGKITPEEIYYDDIVHYKTSRIHGTQTLTMGYLELINCFALFMGLIEQYNWQSLEECVKAKVPIPLFLNYFPGLTSRMQDRLEKLKLNIPEKKNRDQTIKNIDWYGNKFLGSVSVVAPSNQRLVNFSERIQDQQKINSDFYKNISEPQVVRTIAKTIRNMLQSGVCMSSNGSHYGNMYTVPDSECAIADYSDFVFLGEYAKLEEQICSVMSMLPMEMGFVPPLKLSSENGYDMAKRQTTVQIFLECLLQNFVETSKIYNLALAYIIHPEETKFVIAKILVENFSNSSWNNITRMRREIASLSQNEAYCLNEKLDVKIQANLRRNVLNFAKNALNGNNKMANKILTYAEQNNTVLDTPQINNYKKIIELSKADKALADIYNEYQSSLKSLTPITLELVLYNYSNCTSFLELLISLVSLPVHQLNV